MLRAVRQYRDMCEKIDVIFTEVRPNNGTSIKDTVNLINNGLIKVNERQKAVLADANEALFEADSEGNCVWINRTYARVVERTPSELMGHGWQNAIAQEDRENVVHAWYDSVEEDREFSMSFKFETPDGELIPAKVRSYRMSNSEGELIGFLGSIQLGEKTLRAIK